MSAFKPLPGASRYEVNPLAMVRDVKKKSPVFTAVDDTFSVTGDKGSKVDFNVKKLVKELFNEDVEQKQGRYVKAKLKKQKPGKSPSTQKPKLKLNPKPKVMKEKVEKKAAAPKAPKPERVTSVADSKLLAGDAVEFKPKLNKDGDLLKGVVLKVFLGGDGNVYAQVKVADKTYMKQVKSIVKA